MKLLGYKVKKIKKEQDVTMAERAEVVNFEFYPRFDEFIEMEVDPMRTKASKSCLWELYTLERVANPKVKKVLESLKQKLSANSDLPVVSKEVVKEYAERTVLI